MKHLRFAKTIVVKLYVDDWTIACCGLAQRAVVGPLSRRGVSGDRSAGGASTVLV